MKQHSFKLGSATLIVALFGSALTATAGSLTPPSGPIEPTNRVQINQQFGNLPIQITQPGSYVLTGNIVAPPAYTGDGIVISADNVTLDLNGFAVIGVPESIFGIVDGGSIVNTTIRNGAVHGWGNNGVDLLGDGVILLENVRSTNNGRHGFRVSGPGKITRCVASFNDNIGILAGEGVISHCTAEGNGNAGIDVSWGSNSTVVSCVAINNGDSGIYSANSSTNVIDCRARGNGIAGISVGPGSTVVGNTCTDNAVLFPATGGGIRVEGDTLVKDNHVHKNLAIGIDVTGTGNTIIKNVVTGHTSYGIKVFGQGVIDNVIIQNVVTGNAVNYQVDSGNPLGPVGGVVATSPWANLSN